MRSESHRLHGKGMVNKLLLLLIMPRFRSDRRACRRRSAGILDFPAKHTGEQRRDVGPCPHVPGFLLAPNPFGRVTHSADRFLEPLQIQRIELLDADQRGIADPVRLHVTNQIVVDLAAAKDDPVDLVRFTEQGRPKNRLKGRLSEILDARSGSFISQERFRRHDHQRLPKISPDLPPQDMKILTGCGEIADLNIVLCAKLQETLQPRT